MMFNLMHEFPASEQVFSTSRFEKRFKMSTSDEKEQTNDLQSVEAEETVVSIDSKAGVDQESDSNSNIAQDTDSYELQPQAEAHPDANGLPQNSETAQSIEETTPSSPILVESHAETAEVGATEEVVDDESLENGQTVEVVDDVTITEPTVGATEDVEMAELEPEPEAADEGEDEDDEVQEIKYGQDDDGEGPEEGEDLEDGEIDDDEDEVAPIVVKEVDGGRRESRKSRRSGSRGHDVNDDDNEDGEEVDSDADRHSSRHKKHKSKVRSKRDLEKELSRDEEKKRLLKEKLRALELQMG